MSYTKDMVEGFKLLKQMRFMSARVKEAVENDFGENTINALLDHIDKLNSMAEQKFVSALHQTPSDASFDLVRELQKHKTMAGAAANSEDMKLIDNLLP